MENMQKALLTLLLLAGALTLHTSAQQPPLRQQFLHHVFFWLNEPGSPTARQQFLTALRKMEKIPGIRHSYIGTPAGIERDVADTSWTFYWLVTFDNRQGYEVYDKHPLHDEFRTQSKLWKRVLVYDTIAAK